jgi:hypothetical protein
MPESAQVQRARIVANERMKYVAQSLDRAATGCLVVGVFAPLAAGLPTGIPVLIWLFVAFALHLTGLLLLGRLQ